MMLDATAYYGQPTMIVPQLTPQGLFGAPPGQYGQLAGPALAGCLPQQLAAQLGVLQQPGRFLPFDVGLTALAPTVFGSPAGFGGGFGNPFASYGQSIGWPSHQPFGAFGTQALFGGLGSQFGQHAFGQLPFSQPIGGWHGHHQLSGLGPQTFFGTPWSQLGQQVFGQPIAPQSLFGGLPGQYGQPMAQVGAWPGQASILNQQLAGALGRGFQPYPSVPQLAYAG
jgi:hypothetical protein